MKSYDERWIIEFRHLVVSAGNRLALLSDAQASSPLGTDKWTAKETVGHLIDSAANNHQRFVRAQHVDHLDFPGYDQVDWVSAQRYNDEPWIDLVSLWRFYNLHLSHLFAVTPPEVAIQPRVKHSLDRIAFRQVEKSTPTTLEYLMRDYVEHLQNHLDQIFSFSVAP